MSDGRLADTPRAPRLGAGAVGHFALAAGYVLTPIVYLIGGAAFFYVAGLMVPFLIVLAVGWIHARRHLGRLATVVGTLLVILPLASLVVALLSLAIGGLGSMQPLIPGAVVVGALAFAAGLVAAIVFARRVALDGTTARLAVAGHALSLPLAAVALAVAGSSEEVATGLGVAGATAAAVGHVAGGLIFRRLAA